MTKIRTPARPDADRLGRQVWERTISDPAELRLPAITRLRAAYSEKSGRYRWPWHTHRKVIELYYVDKGRMTWRCRGRRFILGQGQAALFFPGQAHSSEADSAAPPNALVVQFIAPDLSRVLPGLRALQGRALALDARAAHLVDALCAHMRLAGSSSARQALAALQSLLVHLAAPDRAGEPAGGTHAPRNSGFAAGVAAWIQARLRERLSLARIASGMGVSVSTLVHRYRAETGETVLRLIQRLRVARAKERLRRGVAVKDAAFASGFHSPTALIRVFHRVERMTPGAYRRTLPSAG